MWLICRATINRGKNKLLIRGVDGAEWVFCPLIKSLNRDRVMIDRCQSCRYFVRFEQIHVLKPRRGFYGASTLKGSQQLVRRQLGSRIFHSRPPLPNMPGLKNGREPLLDLFEEGDNLVVLADIPSVDEDEVNIKVEENILKMSAGTTKRIFVQKVKLPTPIKKDTIKYSYNNGILQIMLEKL